MMADTREAANVVVMQAMRARVPRAEYTDEALTSQFERSRRPHVPFPRCDGHGVRYRTPAAARRAVIARIVGLTHKERGMRRLRVVPGAPVRSNELRYRLL